MALRWNHCSKSRLLRPLVEKYWSCLLSFFLFRLSILCSIVVTVISFSADISNQAREASFLVFLAFGPNSAVTPLFRFHLNAGFPAVWSACSGQCGKTEHIHVACIHAHTWFSEVSYQVVDCNIVVIVMLLKEMTRECCNTPCLSILLMIVLMKVFFFFKL